MKKIIVLLSIVVLFMTGCSVSRLANENIGKNIKTLLSKDNSLYNVFYDGYKYYLPKGTGFVSRDDYNAVIKDSNGNRYYLYVDAIGYYKKVKNTYHENTKSHYSRKLNYNNKNGYIQIDENGSNFLIQFVYNYAKIEALVPKDDLTETVNYMCYILRSIKFNRKVIESMIGENTLDYKEQNYSLFNNGSSNENFLGVVEKYETDDYKKDLEDEKIDLNN